MATRIKYTSNTCGSGNNETELAVADEMRGSPFRLSGFSEQVGEWDRPRFHVSIYLSPADAKTSQYITIEADTEEELLSEVRRLRLGSNPTYPNIPRD